MMKKTCIILVLFILALIVLGFESCGSFAFSKKLTNEKDLSRYIDKYPIIGLNYIEKIDIKKALLSIKTKEYNFPLFTISGLIFYNKFVQFDGFTQIGASVNSVFKIFYDFEVHNGYFDNLFTKERYNISANDIKLPKNIISYIEKNLFILLLFFRNNTIPNIKNGEFEIEDVIFSVKNYFIEKSTIDSSTMMIKIEYSNYKKWNTIYYPSIINIYFQDYEIKILIMESDFILSFKNK